MSPRGWRPGEFAREGLLISLVLSLVFFAFAGKLLRVILWGIMVGPAMCHSTMGGSWRQGRRWMHAPAPPWYRPEDEQPDEGPQGRADSVNEEV